MPSLKIHAAESNVAIWEENFAKVLFVRTNQCSGDWLSCFNDLRFTIPPLLLSGRERISTSSGSISTRSGWTFPITMNSNDEMSASTLVCNLYWSRALWTVHQRAVNTAPRNITSKLGPTPWDNAMEMVQYNATCDSSSLVGLTGPSIYQTRRLCR